MKTTQKNRIPRTFYRITGKMLIPTSCSKPGDIFHIFKNDSGYLGLNTRTGEYCYMFPVLIRDAAAFRILNIVGGRMFRDTETGATITEGELEGEFSRMKAEQPDEYPYNFREYLANCTGKNGFLQEV